MSRALRPSGLLIALLVIGMASCDGGCDRGALDPTGIGGMGVILGAAGTPGTAGAQGAAGNSGTAGANAPGGSGGSRCGDPSCVAQGYVSGTASISAEGSVCAIDTSACNECVDTASFVIRCDDAPVGGANRWTVRMAATDSEIGLLLLLPGRPPNLTGTLVFARLSPDLQLLSWTPITDEVLLAAVGTSKDYGVAPSPSGWIIVGWGLYGIFIHAMDAAGAALGRVDVGDWGGSLLEGPLLVPRPDGPPLVAWVSAASAVAPGTMHVAAVAADGLSVGPTRELTLEDWTRPHGFAFVGDAFFAAIAAGSATNRGQIRVQRIETDGTPTTVVDALTGVNATSVAPVACAGSLCLVYDALPPGTAPPTGGAFQLVRIDATGAGVGNIALVSYNVEHHYAWATPVPIGGDIVTVLGGAPDDVLGVARWPATLSAGLPPTLETVITRWPGQARYVPAIAVRGPDLVVAWGPAPKDRIRIARVTFPSAP